MAWWMPVLAALGVNAGKNILTGQDPLKNAAQAGLVGGITGGLGGEGGLLGNTIPGAEVSSIVPGSIESAGMVTGASGNLVNPEFFVGAGTPFQTYTGGEGLLSNFAGDIGSNISNISPENLSGVASLLGEQQDTSQYRQMSGTGGGVKQGSGQGLSAQMPQAKIFKRRKV